MPEKKQFKENPSIKYIDFGKTPVNVPLQLSTTYPHGAGFPFFTWAQMFFTCADQEMVGFWKGNGDLGKPAIYVSMRLNKTWKMVMVWVERKRAF